MFHIRGSYVIHEYLNLVSVSSFLEQELWYQMWPLRNILKAVVVDGFGYEEAIDTGHPQLGSLTYFIPGKQRKRGDTFQILWTNTSSM